MVDKNYKVIAGNLAFELSVKLGDLKGRVLSMGAHEVRMIGSEDKLMGI